jgi:hypothetical protein
VAGSWKMQRVLHIKGNLYQQLMNNNSLKLQREVIRIRKSMKNRQHNGKGQKDKQRSTKHTYKTRDLVTLTPLKTGVEPRFSGRVINFGSTSGTCRVNLV